jgi:hypothetical protein
MEGRKMTTRTNKIIILGLIIVICVVLGNILIPKREHSTRPQDTNRKTEVTDDNSPGQIKSLLGGIGNETQPRPDEVYHTNDMPQTKAMSAAQTEYDPLLGEIATEIREKIKPIEWKKREFDGMPKRFSIEDFQKAKKLISRFNDNYTKINSFSFHETKRTVALVNDETTKASIEKRKAADNHSFDIEFTRDPLYVHRQQE